MTENELRNASMRGRVLYGPVFPVISPTDFASVRDDVARQRKFVAEDVFVFGMLVTVDPGVDPGEVRFIDGHGRVVGEITNLGR